MDPVEKDFDPTSVEPDEQESGLCPFCGGPIEVTYRLLGVNKRATDRAPMEGEGFTLIFMAVHAGPSCDPSEQAADRVGHATARTLFEDLVRSGEPEDAD